MVATPIGNLADITLRALHVLQLADTLACEDTRHTQSLLRAYGIDKGGAQLLAVHQHNEQEAAQAVLARLQQGQRVAYVSDAGTPGVSDPGARLAAAVRTAGLRVLPLPGARTATTRQRGNAAEDAALAHLQAAGLQLLERNYRTPGRGGGEIDLIMREPDGTVVFRNNGKAL